MEHLKICYMGSKSERRFVPQAIEVISKLDNVEFVYLEGFRKHELHRKVSECDLMLSMYDPSYANNLYGSQQKIFHAMKAGIPSVVTYGTFTAKFVIENKIGFECLFDASKFAEFLRNYDFKEGFKRGENGKKLYDRQFKNSFDQLLKIYEVQLCLND